MLGIADFVGGIDQGILVVGLERKVEVDRDLSVRVSQAPPVLRDGIPCTHHPHFAPTVALRASRGYQGSWWERWRTQKGGGTVVAHDWGHQASHQVDRTSYVPFKFRGTRISRAWDAEAQGGVQGIYSASDRTRRWSFQQEVCRVTRTSWLVAKWAERDQLPSLLHQPGLHCANAGKLADRNSDDRYCNDDLRQGHIAISTHKSLSSPSVSGSNE
jgi:hypothetical protein